MAPFTRQAFDVQLHLLEQCVVRLGTVVGEMLEKALDSLFQNNDDLATWVVNQDDVADQLDLEIEQQCIHLLAHQQPVSRDLRTITTIIKVTGDLERVGDYSVDIAKTGARMRIGPYDPRPDLEEIGDRVVRIIQDTMRAFIDRDLELGLRICTEEDDVVDDLHDRLIDSLFARMESQPAIVPQAARALLISRYLERIADHCTNVAERLHYMETGQLIELKVKDEDKSAYHV